MLKSTPQDAGNVARVKAEKSLRGEVKSVGRHSLIYMLGPAFSNVVGFLLIPIYTRFIDRSEYGVMSLVDVVMTMAMMILSLGVADGMTRFYYATKDESERRSLVSTALLGPAMLTLPLILLAILGADRFRPLLGIDSTYLSYLRLALLTAWFSMLAEIGFAYLRMCYLATIFVAITIIQIIAALSLNLWFVVGFQWSIWGILYSTFLVQASLGVTLTAIILARTAARPRLDYLRKLLGFGIHLVPSTVALQLSNYLNPLMIRWMLAGDPVTVLAQVGLFSAGQKMGVVVNRFVTVPFNAFWRPRRMELALQDTDEVRRILARMCTYATLVTCQIALLLSVAADDILQILVAPSYWEAHRVVPWIAASYVVLGLEHHFATGMHYAGRTRWATLIGLVALGALVVSNVVVIPRFGMVAAAASTLLSVTLRSSLFLWVSQRLYAIPFELTRLATLGVVAVALFAVARWIDVPQLEWRLLVRLACACLLVPSLAVVGFFSRDELAGLRSFIIRPRVTS